MDTNVRRITQINKLVLYWGWIISLIVFENYNWDCVGDILYIETVENFHIIAYLTFLSI